MIFLYTTLCSYKNLLSRVSSNLKFNIIDNKITFLGLTFLDLFLTYIVSYIISIVVNWNVTLIFLSIVIFGIIFQSYLCNEKIKKILKNEINTIAPHIKFKINNKEII
jgi:hypothetical protein